MDASSPPAVVRHDVMAAMARELAGETSIDEKDLLVAATAGAIEQIPGAESCAITLVSKSGIATVAPTDPTAALIDRLQTSAGQGPCLQAATEWTSHLVRVEDYGSEARWPAYIAAAVRDTDIRSTMAFQLYRSDSSMGALNVHSTRVGAFTTDAEEIGLAVATHAALALFSARREVQFASALASRDTIGQAKGMIMERFDIDALQAWELLRKLSQDANVAVIDLARQLIEADHPLRAPR
ncbi:GAF and ANTAR domain-containing protein [Williamsia maris]|uniref:GAF domain-containing protein n=1 Tax=Williamsia maris TaxID=72806 RepID=A0ABT1HCV5_9NOCA|nr:GAF and ANTAR domain-containing protein [Williamsia maris]MCP2176091.1 GAF domain-containing protein [Williamsia maris]